MASFSQTEINAFRSAMLKNPGVLEMDIADRHYKFDTMQAMREQLSYMELNVDTGVNATRTRYASTSKGV